MLIFNLLCYAAVLKILTHYDMCLKSDCAITVYSTVLLEVAQIITAGVLLEYFNLYYAWCLPT